MRTLYGPVIALEPLPDFGPHDALGWHLEREEMVHLSAWVGNQPYVEAAARRFLVARGAGIAPVSEWLYAGRTHIVVCVWSGPTLLELIHLAGEKLADEVAARIIGDLARGLEALMGPDRAPFQGSLSWTRVSWEGEARVGFAYSRAPRPNMIANIFPDPSDMSPDVRRGALGPPHDIYGLGTILRQLVGAESELGPLIAQMRTQDPAARLSALKVASILDEVAAPRTAVRDVVGSLFAEKRAREAALADELLAARPEPENIVETAVLHRGLPGTGRLGSVSETS